MDFLAAIMHALHIANWQRGGGNGGKPKPMKRPKDKTVRKQRGIDPTSEKELRTRREQFKRKLKQAKAVD